MRPAGSATVDEYLAALPPERRAVVSALRDVVRQNLPEGYAETVGHGMIWYGIPLARYPNTYNGEPLGYVAIAAQKNHFSLHLMDAYMNPAGEARIKAAFARAGKKLDMGKACIRFKALADLPLDAIGAFIAARPVDAYIARYEAARAEAGVKPTKHEATAKKKAR